MLGITASVLCLTLAALFCTVSLRLSKSGQEAEELTNQVYSCYTEKLVQLSEQGTFADELESGHISAQRFQELYDFVNSAPVEAGFYLTDSNCRLLGSSTTILPQFLTEKGIQTSLLWKRVRKASGAVSAAESTKEDSYLLFACSILKKNKLTGYAVFEIGWKDFSRKLVNSANMIMTDEYYHLIWGTDALLLDKWRRTDADIREKSGFADKSGRQYYILRRETDNGKNRIFTYLDVTGYFSMYRILLPVLVFLFAGFTFFVFTAARRVGRRNGRVVDSITRAMESTRYETMGEVLEVNAGNELDRIAAAYNRMCMEMKRLIDDNAESARQQAISEIRQLEAQFNPHFMYNTLETIRVFIKTNSEEAASAIVALSDILRYSIDNTMAKVRLSEELHYVGCYLQIQKSRLQERLDYAIVIEPEARQCILPKMIVQPLVENAIQYGKAADGTCRIVIFCRLLEDEDGEQRRIQIEVEDKGKPLNDESIAELREMLKQPDNLTSHIGLYNVHKRVKLAYGSAYGVKIRRAGVAAGNVFSIVLPAEW